MGFDAIEIEVAMGFFSNLFAKPKINETSKTVVVDIKQNPDELRASRYQELKRAGSEFLNLGQLEEASGAYKAALDENQQSSEAHLNFGYVLNELKRTDEAKIHFDLAAELNPQNFDAYFLRALLAVDENDTDKALSSIHEALRIKPGSPDAIANLYKIFAIRGEFHEIETHVKKRAHPDDSKAKAHVNIGCIYASMSCDEILKKITNQFALKSFKTAIELDASYLEAYTNQGLLLMALNEPELAVKSFEAGILMNSSCVEAYYYLGINYKTSCSFDKAIENFEKAISLNPKHAESNYILADIYYQLGSFEKAISYYKVSLEINPNLLNSRISLCSVLSETGQYKEAHEQINKAIALQGASPEAYYVLANIFAAQNKFNDAIENYKKSLTLRPSYIDAQANLGAAFLGIGDNVAARSMYCSVAQIDPTHVIAAGNIAYCLSFDSECSPASYLNHARIFGDLISKSATPYTSWPHTELSNRPLKVGLVSGDFCLHPVGFFLESVIAYLDIDKIEIHAFSNRIRNDELQISLKSRVCTWTSIAGLSDAVASKLIHDTQLDLLIDLSGYTNLHRLPLFAWRPAPVQATWLGYWGSTGVTEIDYILTDSYAVPLEHQNNFTERVWYLPDTRLCFTPPSSVYNLSPSLSPSSKLGYITFGCYQPLRKLSNDVLALWGKIYEQLPTARFRLQGSGFTSPEISTELLLRLEHVGLPKKCIILRESTPRIDYLKSHSEVDILLDSFPYPGGTTTCDALWMGVPTVTLAGDTMLSRQGLSLLMCAGLPDWIAYSKEEYVAIAVEKAKNLPQLDRLRATLRQQVFESPLFDAPRFAINLEASLRAMVLDKKSRTQ